MGQKASTRALGHLVAIYEQLKGSPGFNLNTLLNFI
jgi:hypothetical protein